MTNLERAEAVRRLAAEGESDGQIADRLRITARTALRIRQRHEIAPALERTGGAR